MNLHTKNLVNTVPVTKVSNGIQILLSIREFMLEKKFTHMGSLSRTQTLLNMQQFSLARRPISVMSVEKLSDTAQSSLGIRESTLERDPISVITVNRASASEEALLNIRGFTQVRNPINVVTVGKLSVGSHT